MKINHFKTIRYPLLVIGFIVLVLFSVQPLQASVTYQFDRLWPKLEQSWYFSEISRIVVDAKDLVYLEDSASDDVLVYTAQGEFLRTVENSNFPSSINVTNSEGNSYQIKKGNVATGGFVPDQIEVFDSTGGLIQSWSSSGSGTGKFNTPIGIAINTAGEIYVTDGINHRIQVFSQNGQFIRSWGQKGSADGELILPISIAIDENGFVYVGELGNDRVQVFDSKGRFIRTLIENILNPAGIAIASTDDIYVTSNDFGLRVFNPRGQLVDIWDSDNINDGKGFDPEAIAISESGIVYVSDVGSIQSGEGNNRILTFSLDGTFLSVFAVGGSANNQINDVENITISPSGELAFTEQLDHRVKIFNQSGQWIENIGGFGHQEGQFNLPAGAIFSASGELFVVDSTNNRVQVFNRQEMNRHKAVILAGGGPSTGNYTNLIWDETVLLANKANQALRAQGYAKNEVKYLTAGRTQIDVDGNGQFDDLEIATLLSLEQAITDWASDANDVVIYLADHGGSGKFQMNSTEILNNTMLSEWVDRLDQQISGTITVIIEACKAGSFINSLAKNGRNLIASADANQPAVISNGGLNSFSYYLWGEINNGATLQSAFRTARKGMSRQFIQGRAQNPQLDSNGDRKFNSRDYRLLDEFCLGNCITYAANPPSIISVSTAKTLNGETSSQLSMRINSLEDILQAWVVVTRPDFQHLDSDEPVNDLAKLPLSCDANLECFADYSQFDVTGNYQVTFFAQDTSYQMAIPVSTEIFQRKGISTSETGKNTNSANFNDVTGILSIDDIQVANTHFQVELINQGNLRFAIKSVTELDEPLLQDPNVFNIATSRVSLPRVKALGRHFKVTLKHLGDFVFQLELAEELF